MMKPREVVIRAVEFRNPPRLPVSGFDEKSDLCRVAYDEIKPGEVKDNPVVDQWLCTWDKTNEPNMGQVKGHPLEDLTKMKDFPWPDGNDPRRYQNVQKRLKEINSDPDRMNKYLYTGIFMILWERMHSLHGFENCMMDLMDDTPEIHELADRILEYDIAVVRNMYRICGDSIQGFRFSEDWGTEDDLMISPDLFRHFFLPRYKILFKEIHDCGWHVWMHSCGKINRALPMLIEAGVDVINMQQPRTNGILEIGNKFAGKICFESLCDIQKTLPGGKREEIVEEVKLLLEHWTTPEGGFILGDYGNHEGIGTQKDIKEFMYEKFLEMDPFSKEKSQL